MRAPPCVPVLIAAVWVAASCEAMLADNPDFDPDGGGLGGDTDSGGGSDSDAGAEELPLDLPDEPPCPDDQCDDPLVIEGLADTYTDKTLMHEAFGEAPVLRVSPNQATYLRLPNLAELPATARLDSLTLTLHCTQAGGIIQIRAVMDSWDEATLTATTAGPLFSLPIASLEPQVGENVIELAAILDPLQLEQAGPSVELRSLFQATNIPGAVECISREGGAGPSFVMTLTPSEG